MTPRHHLLSCMGLLPCLLAAAPFDEALYASQSRMLSPVESLAQFEVTEGYRLELVASEPLVNEPVLVTWDGNGRMYVAEMSRYMQDIDGSDQFAPVCQVVRLEDTDGDGVMDRRVVFADQLVLPRMVQCIDDWVVIRETNTFDLYGYRDTDGDGKADEKKLLFEGGKRGGNLEHQPSGLEWNIDNWMYVTYSARRYRWRGDRIEMESLPGATGQWGITHDDEGRHFFSTAGGEIPAHDFQHSLLYGKSSMPGQEHKGFREVFPAVEIPDVQGGPRRFRPEHNTLNNFTGCAGSHIFRGTELPSDAYGNVFIPEPVGRLVRRARLVKDDGILRIESVTPPGTEFIRSRDANFRPVNMETGPDGCLYLVDMYRGIIQEGNWVRKGSYLRGVVEQYGLDRNVQRGRIYRVMHDSSRRQPVPKLLDLPVPELVGGLAHPNGWVRDHSQLLLVARQEKAAVPLLLEMARGHENPLARLHALWTLDGLEAGDRSTVLSALEDPDARVRAGAIRISEEWMQQGDEEELARLEPRIHDPDMFVVMQLFLSVQRAAPEKGAGLLGKLVQAYEGHPGVATIQRGYHKRLQEAREASQRNALVNQGKEHFDALCASCHGADGRGTPIEGQPGSTLAPSLVSSERLLGPKDIPIRIVLKGMMGPLDGKTYPGLMLPLESQDDDYLAGVLSYVRTAWGNRGSLIQPNEIAAVRKQVADRTTPYLASEISAMQPISRQVMNTWTFTASHGANSLAAAIDGNPKSRFQTGISQKPGMWVAFDMKEPRVLRSLVLNTRRSSQDYPREWTVQVSADGEHWSEPVARGIGKGPVTEILLATGPARHVRINQLGSSPNKFWSIHELQVIGQ